MRKPSSSLTSTLLQLFEAEADKYTYTEDSVGKGRPARYAKVPTEFVKELSGECDPCTAHFSLPRGHLRRVQPQQGAAGPAAAPGPDHGRHRGPQLLVSTAFSTAGPKCHNGILIIFAFLSQKVQNAPILLLLQQQRTLAPQAQPEQQPGPGAEQRRGHGRTLGRLAGRLQRASGAAVHDRGGDVALLKSVHDLRHTLTGPHGLRRGPRGPSA